MEYQAADIKELVEKALTNEQLKDLLFKDFPSEYHQTDGQVRGDKIRSLVDYAGRQEEFTKLLENVQKLNPPVYQEFAARFLDSDWKISVLRKKRDDLLRNISIDKSMEDFEQEIRLLDAEIENYQKANLVNFRKLWNDKFSEIDFQKAALLGLRG